jgi:hypothetical protein
MQKDLFFWFGAGLAICLTWAATNTSARADAESDSPFAFNPLAGWAREVSTDGRVNYLNPENPQICYIQILPIIPRNLSAASETWLLQFFDAELHKHMDIFARREIAIPYSGPPTFTRVATGVYTIYKRFMLPVGDTNFDYQLLILFKAGQLQRLSSINDVTRCKTGTIAAIEFFRSAAANAGK